MTYTDPTRLFCPDCYGLLVYHRVAGKVIAIHSVNLNQPVKGKLIKALRLPHTKRTLDRAKREARCHQQEGTE